ncbi:CHROMO domain containing protein [Pyrenophora tritici-repentis]|nr:CHROMO domain containing protein [Pyrenophora tritici-repentis]
MNRSRMDESHENSAPEQPSRATAPTSQTKETLERRASGLPRAHGKNNLFDRDQPLDISDDSDDELPTTITTRKKGVAFIDHRADLSSPLGIRYPLMSEQRRYSRHVALTWTRRVLRTLVEHAYERAQFERQPSTSYVIPREDNVTTFDLWENDAQGNPQRKDSLHTTPIGHTNNDQSKALNRLYDQIRDMWRDLGNERKHSDQLGEQLLARDKVIENLHSKDQETQDILEGYKGDVADTQAVLKNCQDQLQSSVATVARLTEELRDARGSAHEDYQQAQNQAENLAARKSAYKDKYRQEHDAHRATLENMKKLQAKLKQATAKVSRSARRGHTGPSPDSSDSEGDDANSPLPALSRQGQRGTQSTKNRYSDDEEYDHRRHPRPKKPEPEAFSGNGTTSADYLKWKMDVTDWFADYPYEFASETKKLSYIRQKTKDKAFGCLQHGYLEPGAEFAHSNEAWSILDSVYKSLNTSIEAQSWYESLNSTMKPTESMGEYIARFNVGTSALRWPDTLKIQFMRNRLPVWWRDMTAMKVLESSLTYLDFCQTLRLLEQSNPQRATTTGNLHSSNGPRNGGSSSGSGPRGRSDIQVKVLRHLNRCFNCLKKNHTFKATGGYCSKEPVASFDSYPEVQDALEKAIANNGVPVGEPARPKVKGAAASWQALARVTVTFGTHTEDVLAYVTKLSGDICITSYDEIGRIAELSDKEWEDTQHLRAAGAKVLPEDYEKFRDKMERPHMTRQEILKRLPKVLHPLAPMTHMTTSKEPTIALDDVLLELCLSDPRLRDVKTALASNDRRIPHYLIAEGIRMELADLEASNDGKLFIGNGRLVVPFSEKLRTRIIAHIHNSLPGGHGGRTTTYQQVSQWYYWQGMTNTIARFTNNCLTCKRSKDDALPGQPRPGDAAPPEVHLGNDGVTEYVVSQVLDSRIRRNLVDPHTGERGLLQYKVEWVGDDQSEPWQPYHNLRSCKESVQDFHSPTLADRDHTPHFMTTMTTDSSL